MALPLADLENLNWEAGASYGHNWTEDYTHANGRSYSDSAEDWNFDFDVFWAGPQSRFGFNGHYDTITHLGHISNGGAFAEYYFNDSLTLAAKGGYQWAGGQPISGHGAYLGIAPTLYAMPNLALTAGFDWQDDVTGGPCQVGLQVNRFCRGDIGGTSFFVNGEFLLNEDIPVAAWAGYTHTDNKFLHEHSNTNTFMVGLRWYFTGGGTLEDHHRNGALHWYLPGT